jgi:hypothetical protein
LATGPFIVAAGGISNIFLHSDVQKIELGVDVQKRSIVERTAVLLSYKSKRASL